MNKYAVACDTLEYGTHLIGNAATGHIRLRGHNLQACELKLRKAKLRNGPQRTSRDALILSGLPNPVANIANVVALPHLIDSNATEELVAFL